MNPKVWLLIERAREDLLTAQDILQTKHAERAASDAYYAMFHAVQALLLTLDLEFASHSATHAAFGLHFAKTRKLDPEFHQSLIRAFNVRLTADYDVTVRLQRDEVEQLLSQAKEFVTAADQYLERLRPSANA